MTRNYERYKLSELRNEYNDLTDLIISIEDTDDKRLPDLITRYLRVEGMIENRREYASSIVDHYFDGSRDKDEN